MKFSTAYSLLTALALVSAQSDDNIDKQPGSNGASVLLPTATSSDDDIMFSIMPVDMTNPTNKPISGMTTTVGKEGTMSIMPIDMTESTTGSTSKASSDNGSATILPVNMTDPAGNPVPTSVPSANSTNSSDSMSIMPTSKPSSTSKNVSDSSSTKSTTKENSSNSTNGNSSGVKKASFEYTYFVMVILTLPAFITQ